MTSRPKTRHSGPLIASATLALMVFALPGAAHASFLPPELMDTAAFYLAWFVIIVIPIAGIVLFWLVHILPEKIAHKRHHPQKDAIQTLCLLSLVFGGLLWPIAWLWAYTKPVSYRQAYGTDKGDEYFVEMAEAAQAGKLSAGDMKVVRDELDRSHQKARCRSSCTMRAPRSRPPCGGGGARAGRPAARPAAQGAA